MPAAPEKKPSLRQRFKAMRNLPPFLRQVWQTSPALTLASLGLRIIRALLPVAMLYVGKLIIDRGCESSDGVGSLRMAKGSDPDVRWRGQSPLRCKGI